MSLEQDVKYWVNEARRQERIALKMERQRDKAQVDLLEAKRAFFTQIKEADAEIGFLRSLVLPAVPVGVAQGEPE